MSKTSQSSKDSFCSIDEYDSDDSLNEFYSIEEEGRNSLKENRIMIPYKNTLFSKSISPGNYKYIREEKKEKIEKPLFCNSPTVITLPSPPTKPNLNYILSNYSLSSKTRRIKKSSHRQTIDNTDSNHFFDRILKNKNKTKERTVIPYKSKKTDTLIKDKIISHLQTQNQRLAMKNVMLKAENEFLRDQVTYLTNSSSSKNKDKMVVRKNINPVKSRRALYNAENYCLTTKESSNDDQSMIVSYKQKKTPSKKRSLKLMNRRFMTQFSY